MTPEDEQFLTDTYRSLDQQAIGPESSLYVAFEELDGNVLGQDAIPRLAREIRRSTPGKGFFFTGLRGSGKSSQLHRLRRNLEADGFAVLMPDAEDYLDLHRPLDVTQMLFFLVGAISDEATKRGWLATAPGGESRGWARLKSWLGNLKVPEVQLGASVGLPGAVNLSASMKAELRANPTFVEALGTFLEARQAELVAEARTIVAELEDEVRDSWPTQGRGEWKGLVVIADSLDHNRAIESENFLQVRRGLADLFDLDRDKLIFPNLRTVFTLPSYVKATGAGARYLTNIRVRDREGSTYEPGVEALREVLRRRVPGGDLKRVFPDDASLDRLIQASGGHLRMLLGLTVELITQAEALPVDEETLRSSIEQVRNTLLPIPADERELLQRVRDTKELPLDSDEQWHVVAELLNQRLVLGYQNGQPWYDVHPLLHDAIANGQSAAG